jgi:hypothetical protein
MPTTEEKVWDEASRSHPTWLITLEKGVRELNGCIAASRSITMICTALRLRGSPPPRVTDRCARGFGAKGNSLPVHSLGMPGMRGWSAVTPSGHGVWLIPGVGVENRAVHGEEAVALAAGSRKAG